MNIKVKVVNEGDQVLYLSDQKKNPDIFGEPIGSFKTIEKEYSRLSQRVYVMNQGKPFSVTVEYGNRKLTRNVPGANVSRTYRFL